MGTVGKYLALLRFMLFFCTQCHSSLSLFKQPLCDFCRSQWRKAPELCPTCAHSHCISTGSCQQPWKKTEKIISYHAAYLYHPSSMRTLKAWKTNPNVLLNRFLFKTHIFVTTAKKLKGDFIVPIPQRFERIWQLGHSPPFSIARKVQKWTDIPIIEPIKPAAFQKAPLKTQGFKNQFERILFRPEFKVNPVNQIRIENKSVILIDDFMTTGETIRAAARCLLHLGVREISVFLLAIRLNRLESIETQPPLLEPFFK